MALATYTEAEDAALDAAEAAHAALTDCACDDCMLDGFEREMDSRFEAMRDARFER